MHYKKLELNHWQQFENVQLDFHERLTVLTGANGSGKTTILSLFARHVGWTISSLSTPKQDIKTKAIRFCTRIFKGEDRSQTPSIGQLIYSNGVVSNLVIPTQDSAQYQIQIQNQQGVHCIYIPSHRAVFRYQAVGNIPTAKKTKHSAFTEVSNVYKQQYLGNGTRPCSLMMKNALIGWAINGYGVTNTNNKVIMARDVEQISFFEGFQDILRKILPPSLGFKEIEIRNMEIVFVCNDGNDEFLLETASGGISALIDIAWQIYMYATKEHSDFTVIIDEVENHLHPTMQRSILQNLLDAFPQARFIVSTHSPLIVGSVRDSAVYVLKYNEGKKIQSTRLDLVGQAKTASEILDEVLGVSFTMPVWAEKNVTSIIEKYISAPITKSSLSDLRKELTESGLGKLLPYAIQEIAEKGDD